ncbi:MAG: aminoacyl-tRNA hydrolase [Oscillospiraceae bacterium]|nr:aminoacyl-tRNA hydrolase [Oscillospiraceae bacterium]
MWFKRSAAPKERFLIVCLGNPGAKYEKTRHNVGFLTADLLAEQCRVPLRKLKFHSLYVEVTLEGKTAVLMKPQTYMNLSGEAVREAAQFYKVPLERILVIADDTALPTGQLRIRRKGSAGGHNGLKNIIDCMGGDGFPRIKIGVGAPPHPEYDLADWVLGSFSAQEVPVMERAIANAAEAAKVLLRDGIDAAMNQFNSAI